MPNYLAITTAKIITYSTDTKKIMIYKPVETNASNLSKEEFDALAEVIEKSPGGGSIVKDM